MNSYSMRLAWAGTMIGILAVSATALSRVLPRERAEPTELTLPVSTEAIAPAADMGWETRALPAPGPYYVAMKADPATKRVFVCDGLGCPLEEVEPDREGDVTLGPLAPGNYDLVRGGESLGSFTLGENAALTQASGLVWTDGELLHLEAYEAGSLELTLSLAKPGYYCLTLENSEGGQWTREVYIPRQTPRDWGRHYLRTLRFMGLPAGPYTLILRGRAVKEVQVEAGAATAAELTIDN